LRINQCILLLIMMCLLVGCNGPAVAVNEISPTYSTLPSYPPTRLTPTLPEKLPTVKSDSNKLGSARLEIIAMTQECIERYGSLELSLKTDLQAENPYDANEINLRVIFTAPSGNESDVGAFWYQDYNLQTRQLKDEPGWRVRYTPDETGEWTAVAYTVNWGLRSETDTFSVSESSKPGFIHINADNPHYPVFDNGD
jgi:hypothetical protein